MFGRVVDIQVSPFSPPPGVKDLAGLFAAVRQRPYAMLLLSGGDLDCSGYSIMGWDPFLVMRARRDQISLLGDGAVQVCRGNPFTVLEDLYWGPWNCRGRRRSIPWPPGVWDFWPMT